MKAGIQAKAATASFRAVVPTKQPIRNYASTSTASSSTASSSSWRPAVTPGTHKAYDISLAYLKEYQDMNLKKLAKAKEELRSNPDNYQTLSKRIDKLELAAHVNDPAIRQRFRFTKGKGLMDQSIMRQMAEKEWKDGGGLDIIMGRIYQNKVVPDLLDHIPPVAQLVLSTSTAEPLTPGIFIPPSDLANPPTMTFQPFHTPPSSSASDQFPESLYTLIVVTPDEPNHQTNSFTERVHYLKTDIPISITTGETNLFSNIGKEVLGWESPAPPSGAGVHRFVFILLQQSSPSPSTTSTLSRSNFSLRRFMPSANLSSRDIVGLHLLRAEFSQDQKEFIDTVWREQRGVMSGAPAYGKVPKEMKYGYPLSAIQQRAEEVRRNAFDEAVRDMGGVLEEQ